MQEESTAGVGLEDALIDEVMQSCSVPSALYVAAIDGPGNCAVEDRGSWLLEPLRCAREREGSFQFLGAKDSGIGA